MPTKFLYLILINPLTIPNNPLAKISCDSKFFEFSNEDRIHDGRRRQFIHEKDIHLKLMN